MSYAIKYVNFHNGAVYYEKARDYVSACETVRRVRSEMEMWIEGEDYSMGIVEVADDFDFENQNEWN